MTAFFTISGIILLSAKITKYVVSPLTNEAEHHKQLAAVQHKSVLANKILNERRGA